MRKVVSAIATAVVLMAPSLQAQATATPAATGELSLSPSALRPGGQLRFLGSGCPGGSTVKLYPDAGDPASAQALTSMPTSPDGSFDGTVKVPARLGPGRHTISAVCGDKVVASARIRIAAEGFAAAGGAPDLLTVSRSAVRPGRTLRIFGRPCDSGETDAALGDEPMTLTAITRIGTAFKADVAIPRDTPPGAHGLSVRCDGVPIGAVTIRVVSDGGRSLPAATAAGPPVPWTAVLLGIVALLVLIMVVSIIVVLKRHRTRVATPGYFDLPSSQRPVT